ncbi:meiotic cell cortex C-terminal pleckstrin homology-domain-containing protein [Sphaerosporella brunnea]|uniref:Meiotic cell cortex C-terminal pleckstrin homology-domain-containing protein n=1 Tax=Sphaerosporella brunnea TaxID=1250544 RepID=A0A5J5F3J6_9PEZI|nr:meiotic cell cortex C-terminal pleckstrin homology-domain-containing protein [Sphaerosporella brunnea]
MRPTVEMDSEFDTDYATEGPLPTRVPYDRSPMLSRHPSRGQSPANPTNGHGRMSPPLHRRTSQSHHHDGAFDEKISILDPRRFTPTLHANLVAEILSLRRELESKNQLVETLEAELDETRADAENATANVASALKEARDVKRQLARAEKDDAMAVVAQERDEAVMALEELKKQMERLAKSRRAAEEDLEQLRKIQESDNEKFEEAKRVFERRAHVAEGRLKAVLDELASRNTPTPTPTSPPPAPSHRSHQRVMSEDYGGSQQSDAASIRSISFSDRPGSLMMGDDEAERLGISLHGNGMSLADELNFDDSEEEGTTTQDEAYPQTDDMLSDGESVDDVDELPELADMGVQVEPEIDYEERLQELEDLLGERKEQEFALRSKELDLRSSELDTRSSELDEKLSELNERSTALDTKSAELDTQSAELASRSSELDTRSSQLDARSFELEKRTAEVDVRALELEPRFSELDSRKSELDARAAWLDARSLDLDEVPQGYVSTESQTAGLPSPPATPLRETPPAMLESTGIQTDHVKPAKPTVIRVPAIMVSPPEPTPPLPQPAMKDATVQTRPIRQRTRSMQTEQISLDERLRKFAPHLLPSALLPKAPAPIPKPEEPTAPALPRRSSKRTVKRSVTAPVPTPEEPSAPTRSSSTNEAPMSITTSDMGVDTSTLYTSPKTDDDLEVSRADSRKEMVPKNIFNNIDLSLENDLHSSGEEFPDDVDSGNEYQTALSARPRKSLRNAPQLKLNLETDLRRQPSIRRGAMVASGINAHARTRSPSLTSNHTEVAGSKIGPPFPVPARNSSKRPGYLSDRERATPSPTPTVPKLTRNNSKPKRPQSIRKVRSATIMPSTRDGAISPGLMSTSSNAPSSPGLPPPLPNDNISSPAFDRRRFGESKHKYQASTNTSNTSNTGTAGDTGQASVGAAQQTSVVDAIAQTMVGEWMWKYVRRRKTFGVSESPQGDDVSGGQRHKRWVWLAPYERAVMWSSKQPTSGSALLGKSGRKLLIQSVLDVKDDTPPPKGATQPVFNRSILILTPARALKFTAPTKERHYVWLTALSFLSHSPESGDGLLALPPPMPFEYEQLDRRQNRHPEPPPIPPAPPARTTKNAFSTTRDSVRLAKGKTRASPAANGHLTVNTSSHLNPRVSMESTETLSAEPPSIPRFPGSRRRSNSHVHRPQTRSGYEKSLDSYKTTIASSNRDSFGFDSFRPDSFYGVGGIGLPSPNSSNFPNGHFGGGGGTGLWDPGPIGTVRMEAFIDRRSSTYSREYDEFDDASSKVSSYRIRRDRRMSRYEGYWSGGGGGGGFYDEEDFWRGDDPFRNF